MDTLPAGSPAHLRTLNARAVLDSLGREDALSRPDVAAATGLARSAVTQTLRALVTTGVVTEAGIDRERRGPAATRYRVDPDHGFGLGVDVARDRVRVALVDVTGAVRARAERRDVAATPVARARAAAELGRGCVADVATRLGRETGIEVSRAVAAVPAIVGSDQETVRRVPGFEKGGTTLHDALVDALGCPVALENDLNLAALAEQRDGVAVGVPTFVALGLGGGFGAGVVVDGKLHRGAAGGAGEVSFLPHPERPLGSEVLGAVSIRAIAKENGLPEDVTVRDVVDRAERGDGAASDVLDLVAERIAVVTATIALVVEPELFVLTDQAARAPIADRVTRFLADRVAVLGLRVAPSTLGADAVVVGAARAASDALRDDVVRAAVAVDVAPADGASGGETADEPEAAEAVS
ncbi:ROK family protein [Cellulosimicrobium sp. Marseille-Q4280]|uniref:ROK family transcriptional regulator n=1 Tax=Cellulosimicrobium sp. Marseille-Q4280 TaxID=2937992 RepID=UPI002040C3A6|nr:ROK family protein [Cellulosimicrobium sp. Marseille-Q4280]